MADFKQIVFVVALMVSVIDTRSRYDGEPSLDHPSKYRQIWREGLSRIVADCVENQLEANVPPDEAYDFCDRVSNAKYGDYGDYRRHLHRPLLYSMYSGEFYRPARFYNNYPDEIEDNTPQVAPLFYIPNQKMLPHDSQNAYKPKSYSKPPIIRSHSDEAAKRRFVMSIAMASMLSLVVVFAAGLFLWSKRSVSFSNGPGLKRRLRNVFRFGKNGDDCERLLRRSGDPTPQLKVNDRVVELPDESDFMLKEYYVNVKLDAVYSLMLYVEKYKDQKCVDDDWNSIKNYNSTPEPMKLSGPRPKLSFNEIFDDDVQNPAYIASGWPHATCAQEFWKLVWHKECETVVNLCMDDEFVELYYPREDTKVVILGNLEVHFVSEHKYDAKFLIRMLLLRDRITKTNRTVCQYHYLLWGSGHNDQPDLDSLLNFRRTINRSIQTKPPHNQLILVHCSNGLGRTGVFILLDLVLKRVVKKEAKEVNITATLQHLRDQRSGIVPTKLHYEIVLLGIAKEIETMIKVSQEISQNHDI